ncbi:PilW family protein [Photobacterium alginatilyticum]|uniref:Prepilin-type N-terminal cleavage/methylation domain-containing protein n=1 Tax=Photobacterium alginatilyticum TaxID=1775171 RepID=A0ABW9YGX8_9GAMM|nr:prepilin-type N-terminal cleavage/methylation domain-containing protein [Photobacterium alginatilyticum]NBI52399.1 prepilin-type N-terminal cleavage/methylation domain-containing protein [Photobacterium alginatilyticum]
MEYRALSPANCKGMTLIESLVAMAIGILALSLMVSTFLSGTQTAVRVTDGSYFFHEFYDVSRFILDDIRRAGYAIKGTREGQVKWAGAASELEILESGQCIAYAYEFEDSGVEKVRYSTVFYFADDKAIRLYTLEKKIHDISIPIPNVTEACGKGVNKSGEAITDSNSMTVTSLYFDGSASPLYDVVIQAQSQFDGHDEQMAFKVHRMN